MDFWPTKGKSIHMAATEGKSSTFWAKAFAVGKEKLLQKRCFIEISMKFLRRHFSEISVKKFHNLFTQVIDIQNSKLIQKEITYRKFLT